MNIFEKLLIVLLAVGILLLVLIFLLQKQETNAVVTFTDWYIYNMETYETDAP